MNKQSLAYTKSLQALYGENVKALAWLDEKINDGKVSVIHRKHIFKLFSKIDEVFKNLETCDTLPQLAMNLVKNYYIEKAGNYGFESTILSMVRNYIAARYRMAIKNYEDIHTN